MRPMSLVEGCIVVASPDDIRHCNESDRTGRKAALADSSQETVGTGRNASPRRNQDRRLSTIRLPARVGKERIAD